MSNIELITKFWSLFSEQKWEKASELLHQDFVAQWPQSREKIIGSKNFIDVNRYYPGNHMIEVIHSFEVQNKVLTTVWIEADTGQKTFANSIFEIMDGKILSVEEYWAEPYSAPDWRKQWVEIY
jgi:ketosteroid isomerase-like protein